MSRLTDYKELFHDGALLEMSGQKESARALYQAVVKKCATSETLELDALEVFYGANVYDAVDSYDRAIECATIALCCKALLEIVVHKFSARDRLVSTADANTADISSFLQWLREERKPYSADFKKLKQMADLLNRSEKVLLPSSCKDLRRSLLELMQGFVSGRYYL